MTGSTVAIKGDSARRGRSSSGMSRQAWVLDGYAPAGGAIATIRDVARLTEALVAGSAPGIASLEPLATAAPDRETGMFWVIEPPLTWHNGATGGYAAFLGLLRDQRRGVAVLIDAARAPEARQVAEALLATDLGGG
jgi:CubicO group peptidase (beta-lactamase class C family)